MRTFIPVIDLRHAVKSELPKRSCWSCRRSQAGDVLICLETMQPTAAETAVACIAFDDIRLKKIR